MKKQIFLTGMLTLALLVPAPEAKAQGYPTFDVAKLASLITNLIGRFQPVPQILSRVNQVKSTMAQVKAVGQAALSGDLKALGQAAAAGLLKDAFTKGRSKNSIEQAATGSNGATDASKEVKGSLFILDTKKAPSVDEIRAVNEARQEYKASVNSEALSKGLFLTKSAPEQAAERLKKASEAMENAGTIQDSINANTMMLMVGNFGRLNQLSLDMVRLKQKTVKRINDIPSAGFTKPKPVKNLKMGDGEYTEQEKDEADVNFE